ncbi:dephospho-CoA kinase [Ornithinimicrobium panacihumi]|uniref:dephospho-CoA kinase n=1 Tax=Ornithinimicrobium panacihumi TaxID=2008449 RepID=UPI003F8BB87E
MLWVGLSGGIGSGKSTVSRRLAELGAVVIDADVIAREVVEPGMPSLAAIAERFGPEVLGSEGYLDRAALGAIVFADPQARRDLEAITHPAIAERTWELVAAAPDDAVVVHDIPLLVELDRAGDYALTVIVDVPAEVRLERLVRDRGMDEGEARRRIEAQADDAARHRAADVLLDNTGTVEELHARVDEIWSERLVPFEENLRHGIPSRRPEQLTLVDPDPGWPAEAGRLLARVRHALGEAVLRADHVGSTSIEGLVAKDVIDLQVIVEDTALLDDPAVGERLARVGLLVVDRDGGWFDHAHVDNAHVGHAHVGHAHADATRETWPKRMVATADPARVLHCHVRPAESPAWELALQFRDWLRQDPAARQDYRDLKLGLQDQGLGSTDYAEAKEPWFAAALPRAREWAEATGWEPDGRAEGQPG